MAVTPYIKPILTDKGIFYSFQSAIDDISSTFNHDTRKFRFSKFALLNLPSIGVPSSITENKIQFAAVGETPILENITVTEGNVNIRLAESFQNYCLNMETLLMSRTEYSPSVRLSIAERVFWKWLKETGAIRFRDANILNERDSSIYTSNLFVENDELNSYTKVVKYIGEINAINSKRGVNSQSEVYIYVPTTVGATPRIMFDSVSDTNYQANMRIQNLVNEPIDIEVLAGRKTGDTHPFALSINAYYDLDDSSVTTQISSVISESAPVYVEQEWFNYNTINCYYTDPLFGISSTKQINKVKGAYDITYLRSDLDGICIDFDLTHYKLANDIPGIGTFTQFAEIVTNDSINFQFNAVLVYYDIFDVNQDGVESNLVSNLYGILFLDKIEDSGSGSDFLIPRISKIKPDPITKRNGNSLAFKLNMKFDTAINEAAVDKSVNDYNTFSMDLYMDAVSAISNLTENYNSNLDFIVNVKNEIDYLKTLFIVDEDKVEINKRIEVIEQSLIQSNALFQETNSIMALIRDLTKKYNDILNNKTSLTVNYQIDPITLNKLVVRNQQYNITSQYKVNIRDISTFKLQPFTNYLKHEHTEEIVCGSDLILRIDDSTNSWQSGQSLKVVFESPIDLTQYNFKIITDATGIKTGSIYGKEIYITDVTDFEDVDIASNFYRRPMYEIICVDSINYIFDINKIR